MAVDYQGPYTGEEMDAAFARILGDQALVDPLLLANGTKTAPSLTFGSEPTSGWYRAGVGDVRLSVLDQDILYAGKVAGSSALGVGTVPLVNFHIKRDVAGNFTPWLAENADTTDGNAILLEHRSTTTGVGAASFQPFCWITMSALIHDHPTRTASLTLNWVDAGTFRSISILNNGQIRKGTGDIELKSNAGNGNVILTPNGTGRVQLTLDGAVATPALNFVSEPTSGLYRAGAGDLRMSVLSTDIARFARATLGSAANSACMMVGPATSTAQLQLSVASTSSFNHFLLNNSDSTNSVESVLGYTTTTTGTGGAVNTRVAYLSFQATVHDHPTRSSTITMLWIQSSTARWITLSGVAVAPSATNAIDLGTNGLKYRSIYWATQSLAPDGLIGTPSRSFDSEPTSGWYRAGAGDVRHVILGTDVLLLGRTTFTGVTNGASLGIGVAPQRPLHIQSNVSGATEISQVFFDNIGTTDNNGVFFNFVGTTTGVGAAAQTTFGSCGVVASVHDHPTRTSYWKFNLRNSAVSEQFQFFTGGIFKSTTNSLVLQTDLANGNVTLTANGTGRVAVSGGSGKLGVNTIEANTGASVTMDCTLVLPISAARFIRFVAGANQRAGDAVLVAGTVTVACTTVSANTRIMMGRKTIGGTPGNLSYTLNAGVGFTLNSDNAADTSTISFMLIEVS